MGDLILHLLLGTLVFRGHFLLTENIEVDHIQYEYKTSKREEAALNSFKHGLTREERIEFLKSHNNIRNKVQPTSSSMYRMYWSSELEYVAQTWASACRLGLGNPDLSNNKFKQLGQNIYSGGKNITQLVKAWANEMMDYDFSSNVCKAVCVHYTQVVWGHSFILGCAMAYCPSRDNFYTVCYYYPQGNIENRVPYEQGESCSKCPNGRDSCKDNLCDTVMKVCAMVEPNCIVTDTDHCLCDKYITAGAIPLTSNGIFVLTIIVFGQTSLKDKVHIVF